MLSYELVVSSGGDQCEVVWELGDPSEIDRREDVVGGGLREVGEFESRSDGVHSEGMGSADPRKYPVQLRPYPIHLVVVRNG